MQLRTLYNQVGLDKRGLYYIKVLFENQNRLKEEYFMISVVYSFNRIIMTTFLI